MDMPLPFIYLSISISIWKTFPRKCKISGIYLAADKAKIVWTTEFNVIYFDLIYCEPSCGTPTLSSCSVAWGINTIQVQSIWPKKKKERWFKADFFFFLVLLFKCIHIGRKVHVHTQVWRHTSHKYLAVKTSVTSCYRCHQTRAFHLYFLWGPLTPYLFMQKISRKENSPRKQYRK